ncbi:MAG: ExeM/NucH family extracellular endonuclease [Anaerolineales bacterium]|nr:ExeM/NucH family extracellular endonuclease [Anaerolineales bacterium]
MKSPLRSVSLIGIVLLLAVAFGGIMPAKANTAVFINEIHYDNDGTDAGEAIEIAGPAETDLSGWSLVLYNGNGGAAYNTTALSGTISDQQNGYGTLFFSYPVNGIQNGSPDGVALVNGSTVVQFLSYEGTFTAVDGPASGMDSVDIGVDEPYTTPVGYSLQLTGAGTVYDNFTWAVAQENTFGLVNTGQSFDGTPSFPDVIINELDADQVDTDAAEFIELYDGGVGNTDLTGLVLVLFNGSDDASYLSFDLDGYSTDTDGYFVLCGDTANVANCDFDVSPNTDLIQNGADAAALLIGDAVDFPNDTPVTTDGLLDAIVYDTNDGDDAGLLVLLNAAQPQVNEGGEGNSTIHSNQRCPDGSGGARNTDTYAQFDPTPGAENDCGAVPPEVIINEVDADTPSTDSAEFVELYDGGVGNTDLTGLVLVLFNGSDDASYLSFDLDGYSTDSDGYFVLCGDAANVANCDFDVSPNTDLIQNGADAAALLIGDAVDFPNDTPVTTEGLVDAIVYDTNDGDDAGLLVLLNAAQPQVNEDGAGDKDNHSNQRCPNGYGGALNTDTYEQFLPTPGSSATCEEPPPPPECGLAYTPIYTVQGSGFASLIDGTLVDVEGIVTGDFQDGKYGFNVQDALGDGNPATSDGIFVYSTSLDVNVGDHVRVTGYVDEYYELTEITDVSHLEICSTGNVVAATLISLPVMDAGELEAYEGMLVTFPQSLYIAEYYAFGQYGEIVLSTDRQFQPTASYDPGSVVAAQLLADNLLSRIKLDDGRGSQNPDPALHPNGGIFDLTNLFRGGDLLNNLTGVVDYNYGEYKIQATIGADYVSANPRTAQPDEVGGSLKVASFNVLNYFTTLDGGKDMWICGPTHDMECRGADTAEEFARQRDKIIAALAAIEADVVGLIEIENNEFEAVADLVTGLNAAVGDGAYAYVDTGYIGTDAIKVAFIYKTGTVSLVGDYAVLDESVDSRFIDSKNRPALAQSFMDNTTGGIFTAVVNHLKSKGSSCDDIGDPDLGDGAGNCNLTRTAAAEALVDWLATDPTNSGDADFLIIGDLNAYDKEDPIDAILAGGYDDLVYQYLGENAYSYVFDGQLGYLDHALANSALGSEISSVTVWHINADEASLIDYDMSYKKDAQDAIYAPDAYRSSDHDPVLIGMNVCDEIAPTMEITLSIESLWPANHKYVDVTATVTAFDNFDLSPVVTLLSITSSEADDDNGDGDGSTVDDILFMDDFTFQLRAERAGGGEGRIYTITYQVTDACGNSTTASAEVTVPHNQDKNKDSSGEADSLDLPSDTEAIAPDPTEAPDDKDKKDK